MSSILTPGERPGVWEKIGDLARRVARLEAVPPPTPDDRDDNAVHYNEDNLELPTRYLDTEQNDIGPSGFGTRISDTTEDAGVLIEASGDESPVVVRGNLEVDIRSEAQVRIGPEGDIGGIVVQAYELRLSPGAGGDYVIEWVNAWAGPPNPVKTLTFVDEGLNPIMRLDSDGNLHLPTGAAVLFDLPAVP